MLLVVVTHQVRISPVEKVPLFRLKTDPHLVITQSFPLSHTSAVNAD